MQDSFEHVRNTWRQLGHDDPLWAVASCPGTRGNRWEVEDFLATGGADVERYLRLFEKHTKDSIPIGHLLDFGCGVGRLALAWSGHACRITGVDVSAPMIERAKQFLREVTNVDLVLNEADNLSQFSDASFDVVFTHICLQHMPWSIASGYIREFARVCRPGGIVAFQLPDSRKHLRWTTALRRAASARMPKVLGRLYRRCRWGSEAVFQVYCTPATAVRRVIEETGLTVVHEEPDSSVSPNYRSFIYLCRKPE